MFGSKGGAPVHPDWYRNLLANPDAEIEVGTDRVPVRARVAEGQEHDRIWASIKAEAPQFGEYERTTEGRVIPVVLLEPRS